jgi:hypothetical protein
MGEGWLASGQGACHPSPVDFINKAKAFIDEHDEQVDQALDKAGDFAKTKFAGHDEQIDGAIDKAQEMTGQGDTTRRPGEAPAAPPAAPPA